MMKRNIIFKINVFILIIGYMFLSNQHLFSEIETKQDTKASITFGIIDLKFDGENIKICEFGDGLTSSFKGSDVLFGKGTTWRKFWKYLGSFEIPIWYGNVIGNSGSQKRMSHDDWKKLIAFDEFEKIGGKLFSTMTELLLTKDFLRSVAGKKVKNTLKMSQFKAIISKTIADQSFYIKKKIDPLLEQFKKIFPSTITVNDEIATSLNSKLLSSIPFIDKNLKKYRPKFLILDRSNSKTLSKKQISEITKEIIEKLKCELYVIKPIDSTKGQGIIISKKNDLENFLTSIFKIETVKSKKLLGSNYNFWNSKGYSDFFFVEQYAPSKKIILEDGKKYDPAMRVVFTLHYDKGKPNLNFLEAFWKTPPVSVEENGTSSEKYKSYVSNRKINPYSKVSTEDFNKVTNILRKFIPTFYQKIKSKKANSKILRRLITTDKKKSHKSFKKYLELFDIKIA